jgi:hypothetical protein
MNRLVALVSTLVVLALTGTVSVEASTTPASGTGFVGACHMLHDATMGTIPMTHDAPQGNIGMFHAVFVSGNVSGKCS